MEAKIIKVNKPFEIRFEEYKKIFQYHSEGIKTSEINLLWSSYLELLLEPAGWLAMWNIPKEFCEDFNISYPAVVIVMVEQVDFEGLSARIRVVGEDDETSNSNLIPAQVDDVQLKDLFPITPQDNDALNISNTADGLEQLRVFFKSLWHPWEVKDILSLEDWFHTNLEFRLELYCQMKEGHINRIAVERIRRLISEGTWLYKRMIDFSDESKSECVEDIQCKDIADVLECQAKLALVEHELTRWENPVIRKVLIGEIEKEHERNGVSIIIPRSDIKSTVKHMISVGNSVSSSMIVKQITSNLQSAISESVSGDTVVVSPGVYELSSSGFLVEKGTLKGLYAEDRPIIMEKDAQWTLLELAGQITIEKMELHVGSCRVGIEVRKGQVTMEDVLIKQISSPEPSKKGVIVFSGGSLTATKCTFSGFKMAIVAMPGSVVKLKDCISDNNEICIQTFKGAIVNHENCVMDGNNQFSMKEASECDSSHTVQLLDKN